MVRMFLWEFWKRAQYQPFPVSDILRFDPHPYGMRLKSEGLSHGLKTVHRTVFTAACAAAALSSPARSIKKPDTRMGIWFFGTPEGTRNIMVSASSSRRRANVHRTFAFYGSSPRYKNNPNPSPTEIRFGLFFFGTPEGTRTPNPRNRNPMLYPLSHRRIS